MNKQLIWRIAKYLGIGILAAFIASILIGGSVFFYYASKAPELTESKLVATTSSKIYDSKNELIALKTIVFSTTEGLIASVSWAPSYEIFEATVFKVVQP